MRGDRTSAPTERGRFSVSWRHLLCAPLLYSFQQTIAISPVLASDAAATAENPIFFFAGYLSAALLACLACLLPTARSAMRGVPVALLLLLLVLGTFATYAHLLLGMGSPALRAAGGACVGLASTAVFLKWCASLSRLEPPTLIRTVALSCAVAYALTLATYPLPLGALGSLACTLGAVLVAALPLEALGRDGTAATPPAQGDAETAGRPHGPGTLSGWWPFFAAAFVVYSITGFSWGNALFGEFAYFDTGHSWLSHAGSCLACLAVFACAGRRGLSSLPTWPLLVSVGILLAGWLVAVTFGTGSALLTAPLTGAAFGAFDTLLLSWACLARRREGMDPVAAGALAWAALLSPIALGILLAPLLNGDAATLVSPLAGVAFFIAYQLGTSHRQAGGNGRDDPEDASPESRRAEIAQAAGLSPRERDVFLLLVHGHSSGYIAERLGVSAYTVKTHVKHIYAKLGVHTKDEFLAFVAQGHGESDL